MSIKKSSSVVKEIIDSAKNKGPQYNPKNVYNKGKGKQKQPKKYLYNLTVFDGCSKNQLTSVEDTISENILFKVHEAGIKIFDGYTEEEVHKEIVDVQLQVLNNPEDYIFIKRQGKSKNFKRYFLSSSSNLDADALKLYCGYNTKNVYIMLKKQCLSKEKHTGGRAESSNTQKTSLKRTLAESNLTGNGSDSDSDNASWIPPLRRSSSSSRKSNNLPLKQPTTRGPIHKNKDKVNDFEKLIKLNSVTDANGEPVIHSIVSNDDDKFNNLSVAIVILSRFTKFMDVIRFVVGEKKADASDVEHVICQALLLFNNKDKAMWQLALNDLMKELKLESSSSVPEILTTILQTLKTLNCEIWNTTFFKETFTCQLIKETYATGFQDSVEQNDLISITLSNEDGRCHTIEDFLNKFSKSKQVPVPADHKENVRSGVLWQRQYFTIPPPALLLELNWKVNQNRFMDLSQTIPVNTIEASNSRNTDFYNISMFILRIDQSLYLFMNELQSNQWIVYIKGTMQRVEMTDNFLESIYGIPNVILDYVVYISDQDIYGFDEDQFPRICKRGEFLIKRLLERKRSSAMENVIVVEDEESSNSKVCDSLRMKIRKKLDQIYGQEALKSKLEQIALRALIDREKGVATDVSKFHMILCGNPGSGKTMAARIIAEIFKDIGILKNNTFIECKRSDLVGRYIGATAIQTREVAKRAIGGVVFLDEAYTLAPKTKESNDYGREAADELLVWMNPNVDSTIQNPIFIFAGYEKPMMEDFMALNPGFPRRLKNVLIFQDFKAQELASITKEGLNKANFKYPHDVDGMLLKCFSSLCSSIVSKNNGSLCADLIDCFQSVQEERIGWTFAGHGDLFKITKEDMEMGIKRFLREKLTRYGRKYKDMGTMTEWSNPFVSQFIEFHGN